MSNTGLNEQDVSRLLEHAFYGNTSTQKTNNALWLEQMFKLQIKFVCSKCHNEIPRDQMFLLRDGGVLIVQRCTCGSWDDSPERMGK